MGITCKQAVDYISKKEEGKLSAQKRFNLWRHLVVCSLCRSFHQQNKSLTKWLAGSKKATKETLTPGEKEEIIEVLNAER